MLARHSPSWCSREVGRDGNPTDVQSLRPHTHYPAGGLARSLEAPVSSRAATVSSRSQTIWPCRERRSCWARSFSRLCNVGGKRSEILTLFIFWLILPPF